MLIKAIQDFKTQHVAVAFDRGPPLERLAVRPEYKAQRVGAPDEFRQQMGLIREVLDVLKVRVFERDNIEADDLIHVIASKVSGEASDVIVVTADRDYFQMVGPNVKLMMNKRGMSETVIYDEVAVAERFGFGPDRYLDYAALRGDTSDNIEGVAGIGEKTASKLIVQYETLEHVFEHLDELTPKIRTNLAEAQARLLENREFFRFRNESELNIPPLEIGIDDVAMGEWDFGAIRKLFDVLEFRLLYERLAAGRPEARESGQGFEAKVEVALDEDGLARELAEISPLVVRVIGDPGRFQSAPSALAFSTPAGGRVFQVAGNLGPLAEVLAKKPLVTHGSKEAFQRLTACGINAEVVMDTEIAAYLLDPARGSYALHEMASEYLGRELKLDADKPSDGQQSLVLDADAVNENSAGLEAIAIDALAEVMEFELRNRDAWGLLTELELPLARVLAKVETNGVRIDVGYLSELSATMSKQMSSIESEIFQLAGGPFNIGSPPQLRTVLYERLGLKPSKKTKTGFSTDASVLESLREEHPIIDLILRHREKSKLKSTYLDALPPLVDKQTGRVHCRFNQTVAATGRLSSERPNLQNIPIRTAEGKQIRRAFIPEKGNALLVADYSQIELRIIAHLSGDDELVAAFHRGDDIHRHSIAKALGISIEEVTPELRSIGKMVSYGVAYGMGPFGLSQRLRIPVEQARVYIDGFFGLYPGVRAYLDEVVEKATEDGFTTTMLGRRRYVAELKSRNPRVRSLGERQALNAPIQGTAADIMKLAMVRTDTVLGSTPAKMVLTVHDELVFEVPESAVADVADKVRDAMQGVIELNVPLSVDLAWGPNWADAKG